KWHSRPPRRRGGGIARRSSPQNSWPAASRQQRGALAEVPQPRYGGSVDKPRRYAPNSGRSSGDRPMNNLGVLSVGPAVDPLARAREIGPAIAAVADEIERTQSVPEPELSLLHESRLYRMLLPQSVGGDQVEPWTYLRAVE